MIQTGALAESRRFSEKYGKVQHPDIYRDTIKEASGKNSVVTNMANRFKKIDELQIELHLVNRKKTTLNEKVNFRGTVLSGLGRRSMEVR